MGWKKLFKKGVKLGFGAIEAKKALKGAAVGGAGAVAYSLLVSVGYMPEGLQEASVSPYVVAGLAFVINTVRQYIRDNTTLDV